MTLSMRLMKKPFSLFHSTRRGLAAAVLPLALTLAPAPAYGQPVNAAPWQAELVEQSRNSGELSSFYAYRSGPIWIGADGLVTPAARALLELLRTSDLDGLDPGAVGYSRAAAAVERLASDTSPTARATAELALSQGFVAFVQGVRDTSDSHMLYEHELLRPFVPQTYHLMEEAASAPSLEAYVTSMPFVHPLYVQLRRAAVAEPALDASKAQVVRANLQRLRSLPADPGDRYILIDSGSARLFMYENGVPVDSMKVVVGTAQTPTPIMAGYMRYAVFNPYWNVPTSLIRKTIAPGVRKGGQKYLTDRGYQVVSDWVADAEVLPSTGIDWAKVESGLSDIRVRQLPNAANSMGKAKFEFPNPQGIYLHDTPSMQHLAKDIRQLSNGCIRLEDYARFGKWLFGGGLPQVGKAPEQKVDLPAEVPIYITYLTAQPTAGTAGATLAVLGDPYGLDVPGAQLALVPDAVAPPQ